jgi:CheY-like chemotaxis protein
MREKPLILLVDDEQNFLDIISTKLGAVGFEVVTAHNAAEATADAQKINPDLILMDVMMPGETGTDAAIAIKQNPATKDIKIAFLSNMKDPWPRTATPRDELAKVLGMEEFIDKSADLTVIAARVKTILGK